MSYESEQVTEVIDEQQDYSEAIDYEHNMVTGWLDRDHAYTTLGYMMNWHLMSMLADGVRNIKFVAPWDDQQGDNDMVLLIDGTERSGKSVLAQQMAKFCDPTFDISRICFSPEQFKSVCLSAKRGQAVVYDESLRGMASDGATSRTNKDIKKMMAEIGQQNLFIFIVLPTAWMLDYYMAGHRGRGLIHTSVQGVEADRQGNIVYDSRHDAARRRDTAVWWQKGFFDFWGRDEIMAMFGTATRPEKFKYDKINPNFSGRFPKGYVVDEEAYREAKREALEAIREDEADSNQRKYRNNLMACFGRCYAAFPGRSAKEWAALFGVTPRSVDRWLATLRTMTTVDETKQDIIYKKGVGGI
jgi:hypothetical protein